jgi:hypothetical protein
LPHIRDGGARTELPQERALAGRHHICSPIAAVTEVGTFVVDRDGEWELLPA